MQNNPVRLLKGMFIGSALGFLVSWIFVAWWFGGALSSLPSYCPISIIRNNNLMAVIHEIAGLIIGSLIGLSSMLVLRR